jgi:hypothetical protein
MRPPVNLPPARVPLLTRTARLQILSIIDIVPPTDYDSFEDV